MTLPIALLAAAMGLAASCAALVSPVSFAELAAAHHIATRGTAVPLATVATHANCEGSATFRRAAHPQTKDRFSLTDPLPHLGIMPDLMTGQMILPSAG